jgi:hypothetical protein
MELIEITSEIVVSGLTRPNVELDIACEKRREVAIAAASQVLAVRDAQTQADAVEAMTQLKSLKKGVEKSRELVKQPVLEIGRMIDNTARNFLQPIDAELSRLSGMVSAFQVEERKRVEAEQREQERMRQKAIEAQAEEQRRLEAQAERARSPAKKLEILQKQEASEEKLKETLVSTTMAEKAVVPSRSAGMVVRKQWKFEVTDIEALFKEKPFAVSLQPNAGIIRGLIAGGLRECPGLRIFEETSTSVRA